ncbi:MAG: RNA 2',3'-cyclic phosphodiesterase [Endomicrobia bacterium]|nr:RNA 2',3'-cyclic phosphodiesterase [Endomicrobiia bacterium]
MRTFIAVELEKDLVEKIDNFIFKTYREIDSNKISWVKKENLHITLKFLGEINDNQVKIVEDTLKNVIQDKKSFIISVGGVGVFPNINYPRVIWLGINQGEKELEILANLIDEELSKKNFPKETKEFKAHLTIARVKQIKKLKEIISYIEKYKDYNFGISKAKYITFFQSILKPEGPEYKVVSKFSLDKDIQER